MPTYYHAISYFKFAVDVPYRNEIKFRYVIKKNVVKEMNAVLKPIVDP